nr:MAG TPA: hypothetical protein [Caudoviricetes sp.]
MRLTFIVIMTPELLFCKHKGEGSRKILRRVPL